MSVTLAHHTLDVDLVGLKFELLAILCSDVSNRRDLPEPQRYIVLNLTRRELFSADVLGSSVVLILIPLARALGGRYVRKSRAGLAQAEKGLNLAVTSVRYLVSILAAERTKNCRFPWFNWRWRICRGGLRCLAALGNFGCWKTRYKNSPVFSWSRQCHHSGRGWASMATSTVVRFLFPFPKEDNVVIFTLGK